MKHGAIIGAALIVGILLLPVLAPSVRGGTLRTVTITDNSTDVKKNTPLWKDVVSATVSAGDTSNFTFSFTAAAPIPSPPPLPIANGNDVPQLEWWFCIQVNSSFAVSGWPETNGSGHVTPCDYYVVLFYDGSQFAGVVANRTPLLTGGSVVLTPVSFSVQSATVSWSVAPSVIGSPTSFGFAAATEDRSTGIVQIISPTDVVVLSGNLGFTIWDFDGGSNGSLLAQWP